MGPGPSDVGMVVVKQIEKPDSFLSKPRFVLSKPRMLPGPNPPYSQAPRAWGGRGLIDPKSGQTNNRLPPGETSSLANTLRVFCKV